MEVADSLREELAPYLRAELVMELEGARGVDLFADPELFRLLLQNLFTNACRYNERDPVRIELRAEQRAGRVVLLVADNGTGIPAEDEKRVFAEFYRREQDAKRS